MNFTDFRNSKNLLTEEQMKNVKGGARDINCTAYREDGSIRTSFASSNRDLMLSWSLAWDAAGYRVRCSYVVYA